MRLLAYAIFVVLPVFAAIDGKVVNGTTGQAQAGVPITLVQPTQQGMQTLGTAASGADGLFKFDADPKGPGPVLLQAAYQGVAYTAIIQPGQPRTGVAVQVYDATSARGSVEVNQHGILLEPADNKLGVHEFIFIENKGKQTYNDDVNGTYHFYLPAGAENPAVSITPPSGMGLTRPAEKVAGDKNVRKVSFPIRPGKTQIDVQYTVPLTDPIEYSGNILHKEGITRLLVPRGFALEGKGLEAYAPEPSTQSPMYGVGAGPFTVKMTGRAIPAEPADENSGSPQVKAHRPRLYDRYWWVLGLGLAIMAASLIAVWSRGAVTAVAKK